MANIQKAKAARELRRRRHVRNKVRGTAERPRLTVCKSLRNTVAQLIDDQKGETLAFAASVVLKSGGRSEKSKTEVAKDVGQHLASLALEKGITCAVFDRNRYVYHGRIKAVAEGAREGGLII
jgi:large subunit ribosomal protein L18